MAVDTDNTRIRCPIADCGTFLATDVDPSVTKSWTIGIFDVIGDTLVEALETRTGEGTDTWVVAYDIPLVEVTLHEAAILETGIKVYWSPGNGFSNGEVAGVADGNICGICKEDNSADSSVALIHFKGDQRDWE